MRLKSRAKVMHVAADFVHSDLLKLHIKVYSFIPPDDVT